MNKPPPAGQQQPWLCPRCRTVQSVYVPRCPRCGHGRQQKLGGNQKR